MASQRPLLRGPEPPWCIGSVFASRLRRGPEFGPLFFDRVGDPRLLLSTGCKLKVFDDPIVRPAEQLDNMYSEADTPFCPIDVVERLSMDDLAQKLAMIHESNQICGNRLQCLPCSDGKMHFIFPLGENADCIGSILGEKDSSGNWTLLKKGASEADRDWLGGLRVAVSPSVRHPILQIAVMKDFTSTPDEVVLAARTPYQAHVVKAEKQYDRVMFVPINTATTFCKGVSHVSWNPHLPGELAVALDTGELSVYDMQLEKPMYKPKFNFSFALNARPTYPISADTGLPNAVRLWCGKLRAGWFRCEYAWHPRTLLLASSDEISLFDSRTGPLEVVQLATVDCTNYYCPQKLVAVDRFGALAMSEYDGFEFATATMQHVLLFDVRRPKSPLLQWEHNMIEDFPGSLTLCRLASLRPVEDRLAASGKVILATSYRSGDIRVFAYGPEGPSLLISSASSRFREVEDAYCAWELPSKMFSAAPEAESWMDALISTANLLRTKESSLDLLEWNPMEKISGLALLPGRQDLEVIQLNGYGELWSQTYRPSHNLNNGAPKTLVGESFRKLTVKVVDCKHRRFPAVRNYIEHGCLLPQATEEVPAAKKLKATDTKDEELLLDTLMDVDIPLSTFELAFKVLHSKLPEELTSSAAGMPINVAGYVRNTGRLPYLLPLLKILAVEGGPLPVPLPKVLETEPSCRDQSDAERVQSDAEPVRDRGQKAGSRQFVDAYELIDRVNERLQSLQLATDLASSSSSQDSLASRLHFYSMQGPSRTVKLVGARSEDGDGLQLRFREDYGTSPKLKRVQASYESWRQKLDFW